MSKFLWGLLAGTVTGTISALVTSKHTGPENQRIVADYVQDLANLTTSVADSVTNLKESVTNLKDAVQTASDTTVKDLTTTINEFQFETEPRIEQIQESAEKLQNDLQPEE